MLAGGRVPLCGNIRHFIFFDKEAKKGMLARYGFLGMMVVLACISMACMSDVFQVSHTPSCPPGKSFGTGTGPKSLEWGLRNKNGTRVFCVIDWALRSLKTRPSLGCCWPSAKIEVFFFGGGALGFWVRFMVSMLLPAVPTVGKLKSGTLPLCSGA